MTSDVVTCETYPERLVANPLSLSTSGRQSLRWLELAFLAEGAGHDLQRLGLASDAKQEDSIPTWRKMRHPASPTYWETLKDLREGQNR
jgi:hypothetical protein